MPMAQIDPSIYDTLLSTGGSISDMDPQIVYQQELAKQLRAGSPMPGMLMSGRLAARPSVFQYLNHALGQGLAAQQERGAVNKQQMQAALRQTQLMEMLRALKGMQAPQSAEAAPVGVGGPQLGY